MNMQGKVVYLSEKGFGFLEAEGFDKNIFFHARNLKGKQYEEIKVGDTVTFEGVDSSERGLSTKSVHA